MCEGDINGINRKNFDAFLYGKLFSNKYPQITFVSGGSSSEIEDPGHTGFKLLSEVLNGSHMAKLIDRDDKSEQEVQELEAQGVYVTSRRHIEAYLLDDELITKLVEQHFNPALVQDDPDNPKTEEQKKNELIQSALQIKTDAISASVGRGHPPDDIKSSRNDIYVGLKQLLGLTRCGNNADMFIRDIMADLLTEDTAVYQEMEHQIIEKILGA